MLVLPVVFEGQLKGVMELASLLPFNATHEAFLDPLDLDGMSALYGAG
ncbi:MAG TPA: hypothetical protein VNO26_01935 [Candidatus Limnocylindria bacterium]|nr:hypothetical protein [Candidatus Limnocylindria bacterium]